jgi:hypothetical protein
MEHNILQDAKHTFDFLVSDFGFQGPYEFDLTYESHLNYVKNQVLIDIFYDGAYCVILYDTINPMAGLESGISILKDVDRRKWRFYYLHLIAKDGRQRLREAHQQPNEQLRYYSQILKDNRELMEGNFKKFSFLHKLLRKYFY